MRWQSGPQPSPYRRRGSCHLGREAVVVAPKSGIAGKRPMLRTSQARCSSCTVPILSEVANEIGPGAVESCQSTAASRSNSNRQPL